MPYRNAFEMQKPWAVEVVRCINEGGNGGWDANEMTRKNPCTTEWMNQHCINESVSQWINESVNQRMNESMNQRIDDSVNRWINESMVQWSNEPMHQCMNDLVGGWISPRASKIYINLQCYSVRIKFCDFGISWGYLACYSQCWLRSSPSRRIVAANSEISWRGPSNSGRSIDVEEKVNLPSSYLT